VVCVPPEWLVRGTAVRPLLRWILLFGTPDASDLRESYALSKLAYRRGSDPLVGLVIHGVRRMRDAERAYAHVAAVAARHLGRSPQSYGLLADDLHVYRAIAARRPIGLEHPQSRAARALGDVARMLWSDAQKMSLG
jgi:MinD-like ATPase involved in chromosome partitioning or flagellar assembly